MNSQRITTPPFPSQQYKRIHILLASNSPRRRELLSMIVPAFDIAIKRDIDEVYPEDMEAAKVPGYLSLLKSKAYDDLLSENELIITADTVVIVDNEILGKPKDAEDAKAMLRKLSGREHTVITGVTLSSLGGKKRDTFSEFTKVHFSALEDSEIEEYISIYEPFDKAGSYGIQEWIGAAAIEKIDGCFYNVMGLPLHRLYEHLKAFFRQSIN